MMARKVEWRTPEIVLSWEKQRLRTFARTMFFIWMKWGWGISAFVFVPLAYFIGSKAYEPSDFSTWFALHCALCLCFPFILFLTTHGEILLKLRSRYGDNHELNEKGLFRRSNTSPLSMGWKRVDAYRFVDHEELPGIRVLQFRAKPLPLTRAENPWQQFAFDPQEIEEDKIQSVLDEYIEQSQPLKLVIE